MFMCLFDSFAAGNGNTCLIDSSGSVTYDNEACVSRLPLPHCDVHRCVGDSTYNRNNIPSEMLFSTISAGSLANCGILTNGTLVCFGDRVITMSGVVPYPVIRCLLRRLG